MIDQTQPTPVAPRFISLRWRFLFPLTLVVLVLAMVGAYALARIQGGGIGEAERNILYESSRAVASRSIELFERQRAEAQRVAFTIGIPEAIRAQQQTSLHAILEGIAVAGNLDSIIVTDAEGVEVAGLLRNISADFVDYTVSTGTDLQDETIVQDSLTEDMTGISGVLRTPEGMILYTAAPIRLEEELVGLAHQSDNDWIRY